MKKKQLPAKKPSERQQLAEALRKLRPMQRIAIDAILHNTTISMAWRQLVANGVDIRQRTLYQWMRTPTFVEALTLKERMLTKQVTRESVVRNAKNIMEEAMTPRPILFKGKDTGHREIQLGAALTANEQIGKAIGAFGQREDGKTVIVLDIDFSGRRDGGPVSERVEAVDAEFTEVDMPALEATEDDDWLS